MSTSGLCDLKVGTSLILIHYSLNRLLNCGDNKGKHTLNTHEHTFRYFNRLYLSAAIGLEDKESNCMVIQGNVTEQPRCQQRAKDVVVVSERETKGEGGSPIHRNAVHKMEHEALPAETGQRVRAGEQAQSIKANETHHSHLHRLHQQHRLLRGFAVSVGDKTGRKITSQQGLPSYKALNIS
ncbi:uncharacterized protein V6R79_013257 [Siganus canaliculatus]